MQKLLASLGIILTGLIFGYGFLWLYRWGAIRFSFGLDALRRFMQRAAFLVFEPLISLGDNGFKSTDVRLLHFLVPGGSLYE
jgi:hypothetical protein